MARDRVARKVMDFAEEDFVALDENALVAEAAKAMYERDACSIIVTRSDAAKTRRMRWLSRRLNAGRSFALRAASRAPALTACVPHLNMTG